MDAVLTITIQGGNLSLNGPIENKLMVYGMLELAKDAVRDFHAAHERRIQPASPGDLGRIVG